MRAAAEYTTIAARNLPDGRGSPDKAGPILRITNIQTTGHPTSNEGRITESGTAGGTDDGRSTSRSGSKADPKQTTR